jgi:putative ABC transport system permease protein
MLGLSVLTGFLFGIVRPLRSRRAPVFKTVSQGGRRTAAGGRHRLSGGLVVAQVALSLILLVGAGLVVRSFLHLMDVKPGFDASNVLTLGVSLPSKKYPSPERQAVYFQLALQNLQALPGVSVAGAVSDIPFGGSDQITPFEVQGRTPAAPGQKPSANWYAVSPDYFKAGDSPAAGHFFLTATSRAARVILSHARWPEDLPRRRPHR